MSKVERIDPLRQSVRISRGLRMTSHPNRSGPQKGTDGLTVGVADMKRPPPHMGEMHPDGDELIVVLSGQARLLLESEPGTALKLLPGDGCIIPKGEWHRFDFNEPVRLIYVTPGPNGDYRPKTEERQTIMTDPSGVELQAELCYRDPNAAIKWLEQAFGCEPELIVTGSDGAIVHARLTIGGASFAVVHGDSPASLGGASSQLHVRFKDPVHLHYERAVKAGAKIIEGPTQQFYGDITYAAADLEGHIWRFGQADAKPPTAPPEGWNVNVIRGH